MRATRLVVERLRELVSASTISRRARTLSVVSAVAECAALARAKVRAGGVTRPSADPSRAGHNIAMLPDVVREATSLVRSDPVLKRTQPELATLLVADLEKLRQQELFEETILRVEAYGQTLRKSYLLDALTSLEELVRDDPRELFEIEQVCVGLVSELRNRGWSDTTLAEAFGKYEDDIGGLVSSLRSLDSPPKRWPCYVAVTVTAHRDALDVPERIRVVDALPGAKVIGPLPPQSGPFAEVVVDALDFRYAAEVAFSQLSAVLGAAAVFVKTDILVRSNIVVVKVGDGLHSCDTHLRLPRDSRRTKSDQLARIVRSAADAATMRTGDSIFDAIRHRQRALETTDLESRFMLLWMGIERLCLGSPDHTTILDAVRSLVPPALTLGKMRRDIAALRVRLARTASRSGRKESRSLKDLLDLIRDSDPTALTSEFYDDDVLATQWVAALQRDVRTADGKRIADYFERSRERVEWQILRLYRARNSVAHAARGPEWLTDLVLHAHFYLTQLIAICVNHREESRVQSAAEILLQRSAQYHAFVALLRANNPRAVESMVLLRPTILVGAAG